MAACWAAWSKSIKAHETAHVKLIKKHAKSFVKGLSGKTFSVSAADWNSVNSGGVSALGALILGKQNSFVGNGLHNAIGGPNNALDKNTTHGKEAFPLVPRKDCGISASIKISYQEHGHGARAKIKSTGLLNPPETIAEEVRIPTKKRLYDPCGWNFAGRGKVSVDWGVEEASFVVDVQTSKPFRPKYRQGQKIASVGSSQSTTLPKSAAFEIKGRVNQYFYVDRIWPAHVVVKYQAKMIDGTQKRGQISMPVRLHWGSDLSNTKVPKCKKEAF